MHFIVVLVLQLLGLTGLLKIRDFIAGIGRPSEARIQATAAAEIRQESVESTRMKVASGVNASEIFGLEHAKQTLMDAMAPQTDGTGNRGILLYGPPGTGKTFLAKAIMTECLRVGRAFFSISPKDINHLYVGESEKIIFNLFHQASRHNSSVIWFDEIDALTTQRRDDELDWKRSSKAQLLDCMDGTNDALMRGVIVIGSTNTPWAIDDAFLSRLSMKLYIPPPDATARAAILKAKLGTTPHDLNEKEFKILGNVTEFYSGRDLNNVVVKLKRKLELYDKLIQTATFFAPDPSLPGMYFPCDPSVPTPANARAKEDLPADQIHPAVIRIKSFVHTLTGEIRGSLQPAMIERYELWTLENGVDGSAARATSYDGLF